MAVVMDEAYFEALGMEWFKNFLRALGIHDLGTPQGNKAAWGAGMSLVTNSFLTAVGVASQNKLDLAIEMADGAGTVLIKDSQIGKFVSFGCALMETVTSYSTGTTKGIGPVFPMLGSLLFWDCVGRRLPLLDLLQR